MHLVKYQMLTYALNELFILSPLIVKVTNRIIADKHAILLLLVLECMDTVVPFVNSWSRVDQSILGVWELSRRPRSAPSNSGKEGIPFLIRLPSFPPQAHSHHFSCNPPLILHQPVIVLLICITPKALITP